MPYLPPLNLIRKKMNSWHLTSRLTARSFSESTASRVRSGRCPRQCTTLLHGQMYLQEKNACFAIWPHVGTKFFNSSHHFLSMDGWPGDAIFFLWGQPLKIIHKNSAKKRSSPLDFIFDTCASASSSHLFLVGEAEDMWLYPFARTNAFSAKNICVVICARVDTKFLNSSHHVLSVDDWPGDATFFPVGPTFEDHPQVFSQKRSSPLNFIFDTCASASWSLLFWLVKLNICGCTPFARTNVFSEKKRLFCNLGALTQNSWIRPIMSYLWMIGLEMGFFSCGANLWRLSRKYSVKKRSSPLDFIFDTCASASSSHFFGWWSWTCVSVPFCKDNCIFSKKKHVFCNLGARWHKILEFVPSCPICGWLAWWCDFFSCGANLWRLSANIQSKKVQPLGFYFWPLRLGFLKSLFWLVKVNICVCTLLQSHVKNHTPSIKHGTFFPGVWHLDMF